MLRNMLILTAGLVFALFVSCEIGSFMSRGSEPILRAEAPSDPETRFVETRSGRVHVLDVGTSDDVILLLHGTGRSVADWQEGLSERLSQGHRVVGIDYYGLGLSDRTHSGRYGIALWAEQARDVLDALGIDRVTVVGHSAGGAVAAIFTADHPERVNRAVFIGHGMAMDPMQIVPLLPGIGEIAMARTAIFSDIFSEAHERRLAAAYAIRGTRAALLTFLRRQYTFDGLRLVTGTYEDIRRPVLQVHGAADASIPVAAARSLTARLLDARFLTFPGVGHDVHIEAPEPLAEAIAAFIADTPAPLPKKHDSEI
ncbi:MAG: alpha/beta hydrolase [Deltaproteobacteria bacterium]|nr:alpha/beta hydrolase [Deltaproteobacteria bacterium]MBW2396015.1 alpha/beta hydrolase [Deltaproteobacteria bacterium]